MGSSENPNVKAAGTQTQNQLLVSVFVFAGLEVLTLLSHLGL